MHKCLAQVSQDLLRVPLPGWKPPTSSTAYKPLNTLQCITSIFQTSIPQLYTLYLITICSLSRLTISASASENTTPKQIIVFDEIGKMASSMAYLHVAIPLNISTFEQQISIFHTYLTTLTEATTATPGKYLLLNQLET